MRIGMTMPVMEPDLDAGTLHSWATTTDDGPFSSLCWGERIAFDNPECLTFLGAAAAWTRRVPLVMTVVAPQLHAGDAGEVAGHRRPAVGGAADGGTRGRWPA